MADNENEQVLKDDSMFEYTISRYVLASEAFRELCQPLFESTPITSTYYSKFTKARTIITLMSNLEHLREYLINRHYMVMKGGMKFEDMQSGYYDPKPFYMTDEIAFKVKEIEDKYAAHNQFVIITKFNDYCDCFMVSFADESQHNVNFCMNNAEKLKEFFDSIAPQVHDLIKNILALPVDYKPIMPEDGFAIAHAANFLGRPIAADSENSISLTEREKAILYLCVQGNSAKEIGRELSLSPRTIENNLARIKDKYNCRSVNHLLSVFVDPARVPH